MRERPAFTPEVSGASIPAANADRYLHQAQRGALPWAGPSLLLLECTITASCPAPMVSGWATQPRDCHLGTSRVHELVTGSLCSHATCLPVITGGLLPGEKGSERPCLVAVSGVRSAGPSLTQRCDLLNTEPPLCAGTRPASPAFSPLILKAVPRGRQAEPPTLQQKDEGSQRV